MLTYINYLQGMLQVLRLCLQPVNWEVCAPVHVWVPPYINDLKVFLSEKPYQREQEYLDKF